MPSSKTTDDLTSGATRLVVREELVGYSFIGKLHNLSYEHRADIRDRATLERNFREKFEALNRVRLSDSEFARLLDCIVTPDVFTAARTLVKEYLTTQTRLVVEVAVKGCLIVHGRAVGQSWNAGEARA